MKRNRLIIWLCAISLTLITGCSDDNSNTQSTNIVETIDKVENAAASETNDETSDTKSGNGEENINHFTSDEQENIEEEKFTDLTASEVPQAEGIDESKFNDELSGSVKEINFTEKFVLISRIFVENLDNGAEIAVQPAEGSGKEEIIKVYFTNEAKFLLETGKADGSNTSSTESDFSEIIIGDTVDLKGLKDTTGTEFLASEVKIIRVVD